MLHTGQRDRFIVGLTLAESLQKIEEDEHLHPP
jgi:hypothetical protein